MSTCLHCGTPNPSPQDRFCCSGCEFVYQTLTDEGLDRFYDLKGKATGIPVKDRPFQPQNLAWLEQQESVANSLTVAVNGVTCIGCVWLIEKLYLQLPGAQSAAIFPDSGQATFTWAEGSSPLSELARELPRYGYSLSALDAAETPVRESSKLLARLGLTAAFALNAMAFSLPRYLGMDPDFLLAEAFSLVTLLSATFALLLGGTYFFTKAIASLRRGTIHLDLPIALGLALAFLGSLAGYFLQVEKLLYFDFVATFTTLMLGGRYLHLAAAERARSNLTKTNALPEYVTLCSDEDGEQCRAPTRSLTSGTRFLVAEGAPLPVTSFLNDQPASFSLAWINGEPEPRDFQPGQRIPSGAVNLSRSPVEVTADEAFAESLVYRLTRPAERNESSPLLQRILRIYLIAVIVVGVAGGVFWWTRTGQAIDGLHVMLSIFVVSCPCALGVAIPLTDRRAATHLQGFGVFVQNTSFWGRLRRIKNLVLDKTGTLTLEHPRLTNPSVIENLSREERSVLLHLTSQSLHPLSRTLHATLAAQGNLPLPAAQLGEIIETPGRGLSTSYQGRTYHLGKPASSSSTESPSARSAEGPTATLSRDASPIAIFQFEESARPDAALSLAATQLPVTILSGDKSQRVKSFAQSLGLEPDKARGDLEPAGKARFVKTLNPALFLGDGANDSLAFEEAWATGSPVADRSLLDTKADFLFTQLSLSFLPHLFATANWRHRIVRRILAFTICYNLIAVSICLNGAMNPLLAAILMPLSSLASLAIAMAPIDRQKAVRETTGSGASSPAAPAPPINGLETSPPS
ncbi:MAG: heavy metal translocating P-type ATPase metal-binding domain-containing protein [Verrucomicrobiota bacterium JB023]|nr:heavy metal translocating P-type ATPase metal-binding domain-containing protein [Verrucomicrobiota bacterium JB023]